MSLGRSVKACAKINLHLEVLNKRDDGYHNIFSVMAQVDLHDLLKLEKADIRHSEGNVQVFVNNAGGLNASVIDAISPQDNLISRAAHLMMKKRGYSGELTFSIEKNIPAGAGLGGGSSDAAMTFKLLDEYLETKDSRLMEFGASIGADVPFNMVGGFAICEGIGNVVEPITGGLDYTVLVANRGIHIETGQAYRMLNRSVTTKYDEIDIASKKERIRQSFQIRSLEPIKDILINDFERPVFQLYPELKELKEEMQGLGAEIAMMTGSGSTMIGLFNDEKMAQAAEKCLKKKVQLAMVTKFY
ncbi:MAG: 4-(cytidine 5'-diphospho)-2-C-methyl-D-erythritol kinase [Spirochaetae bacterium HGW-Spirochaetae-1]|jgi:4-diphosphocytidyl-2-C-methyl-D-erythritol kinase|nr:MAG: 4-(cytidine 5'-diphospho)-2-C-methyl-D-erythritol kinase [Spirochaetae bacterium HGW-Spirochaetae-1]